MEEVFTKECKNCHTHKTIDQFKRTRWNTFADVCKECANKKRIDNRIKKEQQEELAKERVKTALEKRLQILSEFKPRELMAELDRRGYKGKLSYTQVIDINNL